jgi:hypothetical protein
MSFLQVSAAAPASLGSTSYATGSLRSPAPHEKDPLDLLRVSAALPNSQLLKIRNSTAEFLIFTNQANENIIEVRVEEETVWLTQKLMGVLFEVTVPTINHHLSELYTTGEISQKATIRNFLIVQQEGTRKISRN